MIKFRSSSTILIGFLAISALAISSCTSKEASISLEWKIWANEQADLLVTHAENMLASSQSYCSDENNLSGLQQNFTQLLSHWAYTNGYPYKAIDEQALAFSLYFWPDKRNMTEVSLSRRAESGSPITSEQHSELVAAEKGIPAMEWLIFSDSLNKQQRCNALVAVSEIYLGDINSLHSYHQTAPIVLDEWTEDVDILAGRSIALNLLYSQVSRLESNLRQSRNPESGLWIDYLAEGWRSENTWAMYHSSVTSLHEKLSHTGNTSTINSANKTRLDEYSSRAETILSAISNMRGHEQNPALLDDLHALLTELATFLEIDLAENFSILIGFNNFDGD